MAWIYLGKEGGRRGKKRRAERREDEGKHENMGGGIRGIRNGEGVNKEIRGRNILSLMYESQIRRHSSQCAAA